MNDYVDTAALRIAYDVSGPPDGRPVVAVHGWPDDIHCWDGVLPYLHRAGCRVHRPYLRGFGPTRFRSADRRRSGQIGALGRDLADFVEALDLHDVVVAGHDWGARAGYVVGALFPDRISALVAISAGYSTNRSDSAVPYPLAHAYWYEWYMATARGRRAMTEDRRGFCRYLWSTWSPGWSFADADFEQAAEAWDNPDWADITVHAYLHRWGEAPGDPAYQDIEDRLADPPPVRVPALVLHGEQDGDNRAGTTEGQEGLFAGPYERVLLPGIGHFPPREAPRATADAIQHLMS
ncbi:alpha/beta hydrolase [Streptomyces rimosus subsp. pseudoverticillatus]|uniref:alpha/beta fold hydrolase n=1 Tax=Streptomyces rimosus TaxID=1927 RepID=UPI0006B27E82|nr:alpha/beta hydrolase [Streptomyces rimosus]KOT78262.1 alpha/beta hydrolase [Streptomyces rimosus subsp. pseudoverticillatus]